MKAYLFSKKYFYCIFLRGNSLNDLNIWQLNIAI
jgi:hypothetical protein